MKKLFSVLIALLILCAASASAEARYILPDGWYYNAAGQIVAPGGDTYDSIYEGDCMSRLHMMNWGYADDAYRETHLRIGTETPELGDSGLNIVLLGGFAAAALAGAVYAGKRVRRAA